MCIIFHFSLWKFISYQWNKKTQWNFIISAKCDTGFVEPMHLNNKLNITSLVTKYISSYYNSFDFTFDLVTPIIILNLLRSTFNSMWTRLIPRVNNLQRSVIIWKLISTAICYKMKTTLKTKFACRILAMFHQVSEICEVIYHIILPTSCLIKLSSLAYWLSNHTGSWLHHVTHLDEVIYHHLRQRYWQDSTGFFFHKHLCMCGV